MGRACIQVLGPGILGILLSLVPWAAGGCGGGGAATGVTPDASRDAMDATTTTCVEPSPDFAHVRQLLMEECVSCHGQGNDLDLSTSVAYANLVGHAAPQAESCGGTLVVPGSPETSYLYIKLTTANPCAGEQMPRSEFFPVPLSSSLQAMVHDWIAAGAGP